MGEGNTPLFRLSRLERALNWQGELWAKAEYLNPTGSFKDRGSVFEVNEALKQGKKGVVCASTGNMAASLAAYAARVLLTCVVVIPKGTPDTKLKQALICGAQLIKIEGSYDMCVDVAKDLASKENLLLCGDYELRRIGQRSIGVELAKSPTTLDAFVCPVGNGTVGCAVIEGFESQAQLPKFIGIQGTGADPLTQAWRDNTAIKPIPSPQTIASAMNVGNPLDGKLTLDWITKSNGAMLSVTNEEIRSAQKLIAQKEGIFVESAAAATVAGLISYIKVKNINSKIVLILTGNGLKENS